MEEESFADQGVADILNRSFVAIKVDREERPDVDNLYMTVCQAMTGQGGWPLTILMTPEQKPFFAGTYIPKEDRYGRTGLVNLLTKIDALWKEERSRAEGMSERVMEAIRGYTRVNQQGEVSRAVFDDAFESYARQYDEEYGGFGAEPKFPRPHELLFLLRYGHMNQEQEAIEMVEHTLTMMHRGGIYDHLGYGFARYSVDREWLVPHFEKMLYDQSLLALAYTEAYQLTKKVKYRQVVEEIFTYVDRDLTHPEGGFYSAEDADSEGVEGKFYVWTPAEIKEILGEEEGELFCKAYGVSEEGNFEQGWSILNQLHFHPPTLAKQYQMTEDQLQKRLEVGRQKLFQVREARIHPHKDDKVLTSWNGLMIAAYAYAGRVFQNEKYVQRAKKAVSFIHHYLQQEKGRLLVRYRDGEAKIAGFLDDYAYLSWGLLELYEATFDVTYLQKAIQLLDQAKELFWDRKQGGFFFSGQDSEELLVRTKEIYDGAQPSGNAVIAYSLVRIAAMTGDEKWRNMAQEQIQSFAGTVVNTPTAHAFFLIALQFVLGQQAEIVVAGERTNANVEKTLSYLQEQYLPAAVLLFHDSGAQEAKEGFFPKLKVENQPDAPPMAVYICENFACQKPLLTLQEVKNHFQQSR